jgi:hypothetical protein
MSVVDRSIEQRVEEELAKWTQQRCDQNFHLPSVCVSRSMKENKVRADMQGQAGSAGYCFDSEALT